MDKIISFCGLSCQECDAYLASETTMTAAEKEKLAEKWTKLYGHGRIIQPEEIICDGCLTECGWLWSNCSNCEIRKCGKEKKVKNCAYCSDYACDKLEGFFREVPDARIKLDAIRQRV
jgi:hypothetical protein